MTHAEIFEQHRGLLFTVAYEILGAATDAEDAVQNSYQPWSESDLDQIRDPRAYLVRVVGRRALDVLRAQARRRETYVGPWLPEPVTTGPDTEVDLAESVSMAMLLVLETLSPTERAVFVLREVFDFPYDDIAKVVGKTPDGARQIAHRAREHVATRRRRYTADMEQASAITVAFLAATQQGDIASLVAMLAPDAVAISDGGGIVSAARRPVSGAERVARFLAGLAAKSARGEASIDISFAISNGLPGVAVREDGVLSVVLQFEIVDGAVQTIYMHRNPHKLSMVGSTPTIMR
ncbi:RNA polymerase sigma-70 factor [Hoyosella rhizosphaerae]|uniref:Sigma factor n=1 Tax=Hoyosella rhizosphaerae TaxID=1755582 RepID=A0A916U408_9ACTN|nr:RNA polymerase sigma-70 factor [Hoyosella rhizosphaerae]GGC58020.1 putative sigma factor [Hoyosella rhizosphaerae]